MSRPSEQMGQAGNLALDDYSYSTIPTLIPLGQSVSLSIQIEADSDFEILKRMCYVGNVLNTTALLTVQMTDTGSGRNLFNTPVIISNAFGTAQFPFIMQQTKIFSARSVIALTVANLGDADVPNCQLTFSGRKIFRNKQY